MNERIDLQTVLGVSGKLRAEHLALFALINLGIVESLTNGVVSAADALRIFYHADNCLFVRKELRAKAADEIMSRGVQLPDLFETLPTAQAQREFHRELAKLRTLCLRLLGSRRQVA